MGAKIKVSYTDDEDLKDILKLLSPKILSYKISKQQKGVYKRAYIDMKAGVLHNVLVTKNSENP